METSRQLCKVSHTIQHFWLLPQVPPMAVVSFFVRGSFEYVPPPQVEGQTERQERELVHGQPEQIVYVVRNVVDGVQYQTQGLQVFGRGHRERNRFANSFVES